MKPKLELKLIMKNLALRLTLLIFLMTSAVQLTSAQTTMNAESEVRRLNTEEVNAFLTKDPKKMEQLWSADFVVTNPLNKFVTGRQVLEMMTSGFLIITAYDRQIEYLRTYGDTVIVAGAETVTWGGRMPNAGKVEHLRFTAVWMKQNGRFQEVARHANVVPQASGAQH